MRILIVDDHPAVRSGLRALLRLEPGLAPVAAAEGCAEALEILGRHRIECVLADFHLGDRDGLDLCRAVKSGGAEGEVAFVLYSAFVDDGMTCAARLAGADGVVSKSAEPEVLFDALRRAAKGLPYGPPANELVAESGKVLEIEDVPLVAMRLEGASLCEAAAAVGIECEEAAHRVERAISLLSGRTAGGVAAPSLFDRALLGGMGTGAQG